MILSLTAEISLSLFNIFTQHRIFPYKERLYLEKIFKKDSVFFPIFESGKTPVQRSTNFSLAGY